MISHQNHFSTFNLQPLILVLGEMWCKELPYQHTYVLTQVTSQANFGLFLNVPIGRATHNLLRAHPELEVDGYELCGWIMIIIVSYNWHCYSTWFMGCIYLF